MSFFPGHFERTKCLEIITKNNSQGIIFVIMSCQRVGLKKSFTSWLQIIEGIWKRHPEIGDRPRKVLSNPPEKVLSNPPKDSIEPFFWAPKINVHSSTPTPVFLPSQEETQTMVREKLGPKLRPPQTLYLLGKGETQTMVWVSGEGKLRPWSEFRVFLG